MEEIQKINEKYNYDLFKFIKRNEEYKKFIITNKKKDYWAFKEFINEKDNLVHFNFNIK